MEIKTATFVISNTDYKKSPTRKLPEYAFIGRSNVGKSSLINMLCGNKSLAKTSGKPGKTQLINHFIINEKEEPWYLVDLPGYGYAKVSKTLKERWGKFLQEYILKRENLLCMFVLIDSRLEPQKIDLEFMQWLGEKGVPFVMVFTKKDKLPIRAFNKNMGSYNKKMLELWEELPKQFFSSSINSDGKEEILSFIEETNKLMVE
ncbi:MAG: YihA family ribosome biogenesis GTP-binding protein [Bacteroidetes bacterium]|nr:YihA family ribosome biogenesis GTP-binding protein [Bacteroidota bacterium]